jgi:hypothetical protein
VQKDRVEDYEDDSTIAADERLVRRVAPASIVFDKNLNAYRASSQVFRTTFLSIFLETKLQDRDLTCADTLEGCEGYSAVALTAKVARDEDQKVVHEPNDEPPPHRCDPAHGLVVGTKTSKVGKRLAKAAQMVVAGDLSQAQRE